MANLKEFMVMVLVGLDGIGSHQPYCFSSQNSFLFLLLVHITGSPGTLLLDIIIDPQFEKCRRTLSTDFQVRISEFLVLDSSSFTSCLEVS